VNCRRLKAYQNQCGRESPTSGHAGVEASREEGGEQWASRRKPWPARRPSVETGAEEASEVRREDSVYQHGGQQVETVPLHEASERDVGDDEEVRARAAQDTEQAELRWQRALTGPHREDGRRHLRHSAEQRERGRQA
jgi:hypothetical protein